MAANRRHSAPSYTASPGMIRGLLVLTVLAGIGIAYIWLVMRGKARERGNLETAQRISNVEKEIEALENRIDERCESASLTRLMETHGLGLVDDKTIPHISVPICLTEPEAIPVTAAAAATHP